MEWYFFLFAVIVDGRCRWCVVSICCALSLFFTFSVITLTKWENNSQRTLTFSSLSLPMGIDIAVCLKAFFYSAPIEKTPRSLITQNRMWARFLRLFTPKATNIGKALTVCVCVCIVSAVNIVMSINVIRITIIENDLWIKSTKITFSAVIMTFLQFSTLKFD